MRHFAYCFFFPPQVASSSGKIGKNEKKNKTMLVDILSEERRKRKKIKKTQSWSGLDLIINLHISLLHRI
jgi:hypothetical protein